MFFAILIPAGFVTSEISALVLTLRNLLAALLGVPPATVFATVAETAASSLTRQRRLQTTDDLLAVTMTITSTGSCEEQTSFLLASLADGSFGPALNVTLVGEASFTECTVVTIGPPRPPVPPTSPAPPVSPPQLPRTSIPLSNNAAALTSATASGTSAVVASIVVAVIALLLLASFLYLRRQRKRALHSSSGNGPLAASDRASSAAASTKLSSSKAKDVIPWNDVELLEMLAGKGCGFGTVFKAIYDGELCVLRRLEPPLLQGVQSQFRLSAGSSQTIASGVHSLEELLDQTHALAQLQHAHLANVIGFASDLTRNHGVVSEMAPWTLSRLLVSDEAVDLTWANTWLRVIIEIAEALAHLHSLGFVHLSLNPENVLLNSDFTVKLTDYGRTAKALKALCQDISDSGSAMRSPYACFAPELVRMESFDAPVDIWSYGCILAHIGSRVPLWSSFGDSSFYVVMLRVCSNDASPVDEMASVPNCPSEMIELARRCVSLDPTRRPQSSRIALALPHVLLPDERLQQRNTIGDYENPRASAQMPGAGPLPAPTEADRIKVELPPPMSLPVTEKVELCIPQPLPQAPQVVLTAPIPLPQAPKVDINKSNVPALPEAPKFDLGDVAVPYLPTAVKVDLTSKEAGSVVLPPAPALDGTSNVSKNVSQGPSSIWKLMGSELNGRDSAALPRPAAKKAPEVAAAPSTSSSVQRPRISIREVTSSLTPAHAPVPLVSGPRRPASPKGKEDGAAPILTAERNDNARVRI